MRLVRKTLRFGRLPDLYTFECQTCGETHIEEAATPEPKDEWVGAARQALSSAEVFTHEAAPRERMSNGQGIDCLAPRAGLPELSDVKAPDWLTLLSEQRESEGFFRGVTLGDAPKGQNAEGASIKRLLDPSASFDL
jgi:hypothetical protein